MKHMRERQISVLGAEKHFPADLDVESSVAIDQLYQAGARCDSATVSKDHVKHNRVWVLVGIATQFEISTMYIAADDSSKIFCVEDVDAQSLVNASRSMLSKAQLFFLKKITLWRQYIVAFIKVG